MVTLKTVRPAISCSSSRFESGPPVPLPKVGFVKLPSLSLGLNGSNYARLSLVQATEESTVSMTNSRAAVVSGESPHLLASNGKARNIVRRKSSVGKLHRQELLQQKGCVIWITGLIGSGNSTLACALCQALYSRGKLTYILDGDNVRHGLNFNLTFKAEDRAENIRRIGEEAKLFVDTGIICIASVISPYRRDRDAYCALLPEGEFIERFFIALRTWYGLVFMDVPIEICKVRDPKGLYKLARAGKIKGVCPEFCIWKIVISSLLKSSLCDIFFVSFTGVDDPHEPPLNCELGLPPKGNNCASPSEMAGTMISYLEEKGYLQA